MPVLSPNGSGLGAGKRYGSILKALFGERPPCPLISEDPFHLAEMLRRLNILRCHRQVFDPHAYGIVHGAGDGGQADFSNTFRIRVRPEFTL